MEDSQEFLALSRTFKIVDGVLSDVDQMILWRTVQEANSPVTGHSAPVLGATQVLVSGQIVDLKYRVIELLGKGGMGSVYRVQHLLLNKEMALKTFPPEALTLDAWERFQREAKSIAKLTHANIVQVFDFGIGQGNVPYYTMEVLSGCSLAQKLRSNGPMAMRDALPILTAVAGALAHAHKMGIVHRDIKPANIFLDQDRGGKVVTKVVDFGIAKLATSGTSEDQSQTDSGMVFGSPLYMSPEQSMGRPTDHRTDIYSFGCTAFELLAGKPPFVGTNAFDTIRMHHDLKPPSLVEASGGKPFSRLAESFVAKLLNKSILGRYQSFDDVIVDLKRLAAEPVSSERDQVANSAGAGGESEKPRMLLEVTGENTQGNSQQNTVELGLRSSKGLIVAVAAIVVFGALAVAVTSGTFNLRMKRTPAKAASPDAESSKRTYYSVLSGHGDRIFYWPSDVYLGRVTMPEHNMIRTSGVLTVRAGTPVTFIPGEPLVGQPELFSHFRPDDFFRLELRSEITWSKKQLDPATKYLTSLIQLDLSEADIDSSCIELVNRLSKLNVLDVNGTKITGNDLTHLSRLRDLRALYAADVKGISPALAALKDCQAMEQLFLDGCGVNAEDLNNISSMSNLRTLGLQRNDISGLSLASLSKLKRLRLLFIGGHNFSRTLLKTFPRLDSLEELIIPLSDITPVEQAALRKLLPSNCRISHNSENDPVRTALPE
ncbi:MAG: protein kinase [Cyanobacteria bacterium SZAS TMP-1]|nr:protein kinase [Cyanobacteria bacterium SZAS TMP-1]